MSSTTSNTNFAQGSETHVKGQSRTLLIVLFVNASMFGIELVMGLRASSIALLADAADMLGDALAFAISLGVVGRALIWKVKAARIKAYLMLVFGCFVLLQAVYKLLTPQMPVFATVGMAGIIALCANVYCFSLLLKHRGDDVNMTSVWLCSRNDIIANIAVITSAFFVYVSQSQWPDIIVGLGIAGLFIYTAVSILQKTQEESRV